MEQKAFGSLNNLCDTQISMMTIVISLGDWELENEILCDIEMDESLSPGKKKVISRKTNLIWSLCIDGHTLHSQNYTPFSVAFLIVLDVVRHKSTSIEKLFNLIGFRRFLCVLSSS